MSAILQHVSDRISDEHLDAAHRWLATRSGLITIRADVLELIVRELRAARCEGWAPYQHTSGDGFKQTQPQHGPDGKLEGPLGQQQKESNMKAKPYPKGADCGRAAKIVQRAYKTNQKHGRDLEDAFAEYFREEKIDEDRFRAVCRG